MQSIILIVGGIFWILTYIFIISKGYKDKTYGMPLLALCANISWEFIFSFLFPHSPHQLYINYLWFALDVVIVFQFFKYYKNEFPTSSSPRKVPPTNIVLKAVATEIPKTIHKVRDDKVGNSFL